jgi:DNA topoisomerase-1
MQFSSFSQIELSQKLINKYSKSVLKFGHKNWKSKKNTEFKSIKKNVDIAKLKRGEYELNDIIDQRGSIETGGIHLGVYDDEEIVLKKGKYGLYFTWNGQNKSLSGAFPKSKNPNSISYNDIVNIIESSLKQAKDNNDTTSECTTATVLEVKSIVRKISDSISIRNGKYGDYIFYKTSEMKNPTFLKLKGFTGNYKTCSLDSILEWIKDTYKIC